MNKSQKLIPLIVAVACIGVLIWYAIQQITPIRTDIEELSNKISTKQAALTKDTATLNRMKSDAEKAKHASADVAKKIYYPTEADLGQDSIYFTLFNDMLDLLKQNNIKIRTI